MARRQARRPVRSRQPGQGRQARLGHRGHTARPATPGSRAKSRGLVHPDRQRRHRARRLNFICAIHPWMQGSIEVLPSVAPALAARPAVDHPPRLGRRAFLGVLGGGALAILLPSGRRLGALLPFGAQPPSAVAAAPFRRRCRSPGAARGRPRDPDPRGRGADPPRPQDAGCGPTAAPSRGRRSGARRASAPRSPSARAAARGRRAHRPPARRPQPHPVRRPARRPDQLPAASPSTAGSPRALPPRESGNDLLIRPGREGPTSTT